MPVAGQMTIEVRTTPQPLAVLPEISRAVHLVDPRLVKRLGISSCASRRTLQSTFASLLIANEETVKVVQELLRDASSKITRPRWDL